MKKNTKRVFSAVIAASLTLSMGVAAFAEQHTNITVKGGAGGSGSSVYVKPDEEPFTDVDENDWFYDDVVKVYKAKLMEGTSDTEFSPYGRLTRGMVATIEMYMMILKTVFGIQMQLSGQQIMKYYMVTETACAVLKTM